MFDEKCHVSGLFVFHNPSNKILQKQMRYTYPQLGKQILDFGVWNFMTCLCYNTYQCLKYVMRFQFHSYTHIKSTNVKNVTARAPTLVCHTGKPWANLSRAAITSVLHISVWMFNQTCFRSGGPSPEGGLQLLGWKLLICYLLSGYIFGNSIYFQY